MKNHKQQTAVSKTMNAFINNCLNEPILQDGQVVARTVNFDDGLHMDIRCCGIDDKPAFTKAVLLNHHNEELCSTTSQKFVQHWQLQYKGDTYATDMAVI